MSKEINLGEMLKFTEDVRAKDGIPSKDNIDLIKKQTKSTDQYDRELTDVERKSYEISRGQFEGVSKEIGLAARIQESANRREVDESSLVGLKNKFDEVSSQIVHEDQIGVVAKAIADTIIPVNYVDVNEKFKEIDAKHSGLYSETTREILKEEFVNSQEVRDNQLMEGVNRALTTIADVAIEKKYRSNIEEKLKKELGIKPNSKVEENVVVPDAPIRGVSEIPDKKGISATQGFDAAKVREMNTTAKRSDRLKSIRSRLGSKTTGYFPNSGIKFEMNSTASLLEREDMYSELEKIYNSNGLKNMSKFITEASKHVTLLIGDKDPAMLNPGDLLRSKLHAYDFKYLLLYKAISVGETKVDGETTCPRCDRQDYITADLLDLLKGWSQEQYRSFENYNADNTYDKLTESWKKVIHTETMSVGGFDTEDGCVFDDVFNAKYNKLFYTINYSDPTIEKYMNIKNAAFAVMIWTFQDSIPKNVADDDAIMDHINRVHGDRVARLQTIMESLVVIDSIKLSYVYEDPNSEPGTPGLVVGEDTITIEDLTAPQIYSLINDEVDPMILEKARDFLVKRYHLKEKARQLELNKGYKPEDLEGIELTPPTLLEDMIFLNLGETECPHCKHKYSAEVSSLWLGLEAIQKSLKRMKN